MREKKEGNRPVSEEVLYPISGLMMKVRIAEQQHNADEDDEGE